MNLADELMAECVRMNAEYGTSFRTHVRPNGGVAVLRGDVTIRLFDLACKEFSDILNLHAALAFVSGLGRGMREAHAVTSADLERMAKEAEGPDHE